MTILEKPWIPLITVESIKNEIQPLQNFGSSNVKQKNYKKCYVHNIFTIFSKQILSNKLLLPNRKSISVVSSN